MADDNPIIIRTIRTLSLDEAWQWFCAQRGSDLDVSNFSFSPEGVLNLTRLAFLLGADTAMDLIEDDRREELVADIERWKNRLLPEVGTA
jgi:hypothetical protein